MKNSSHGAGSEERLASRRQFLSSVAGVTAVSLTSKSVLGGQAIQLGDDEGSENPFYTAFVGVPTF